MKSEEIWKAIPSYEGYYEASTFGRVRSVDRVINALSWRGNPSTKRLKAKIRAPYFPDRKYGMLLLSKDNIKVTRSVHSLVCETFHGPCPPGHQVAHLNGTRADNRPENLRWATPKENMGHQLIHGTRTQMGETQNFAKLNQSKVRAARSAYSEGVTFTVLSRQFGVARSTIRDAVLGVHWAHVE